MLWNFQDLLGNHPATAMLKYFQTHVRAPRCRRDTAAREISLMPVGQPIKPTELSPKPFLQMFPEGCFLMKGRML